MERATMEYFDPIMSWQNNIARHTSVDEQLNNNNKNALKEW